MSIRPLCTVPQAILRGKAQAIPAVTPAITQLVQDMIETMHAHEGIGIAAPQVGAPVRVFVANPSRTRGQEIVLINPQVESCSGRVAVLEGCLSIPKIWGRVRRAAAVRVSGTNLAGAPVRVEAQGLLAIVLQHELDHLEGRLFIDRLSWLKRQQLALRGLRAAG